jgi:hypothetical protein
MHDVIIIFVGLCGEGSVLGGTAGKGRPRARRMAVFPLPTEGRRRPPTAVAVLVLQALEIKYILGAEATSGCGPPPSTLEPPSSPPYVNTHLAPGN